MERYHIFRLGLAVLFYAVYCIRPMVVNAQEIENAGNDKRIKEEDLVFYQGVEGKPGVDFPILSHIPRTSFSCRDVESGYYADLETDCQVFHICEENRKISFLCPNGTIFQQSDLICEWWFKVNCTNSPNLYEESAEQLREENAKRKESRRVLNYGAIMRTEERTSVSNSRNGMKKITKKVVTGNGRRSNHASNYNDDLDQNDLSRSPSSDFVRERHRNGINSGRKAMQFQQSNEGYRKTENTTQKKNYGDYGMRANQNSFSTTTSTTNRNNFNSYRQSTEKINFQPASAEKTTRGSSRQSKKLKFESDSNEAQIPQETTSFYKNSFNSIHQDVKSTSANPYPNHRESYSELKEPKFYSTKSFSAISSVTPQYLTTQPINNGKPFIGSQVGTTLRSSVSTSNSFGSNLTIPPVGSLNVGTTFSITTTTTPSTTTSTTTHKPSTGRVLDHATVYGKAPRYLPTTPVPKKQTIVLSKSVFSGSTLSTKSIGSTSSSKSIESTASTKSVSTTPKPKKTTILLSKFLYNIESTKSPNSAEILTAADSYNRGTPQVRFYGKVQSETKFNRNTLDKSSPINSISSKSFVSSTANPLSLVPTTTARSVGTTLNFEAELSTTTLKPTGFFITKGLDRNQVNEINRPRPFQLPPEPSFNGKAVYKTEELVTPTIPTYKISSASPFAEPSTPEPTIPTPFTTARSSTIPSTFENVDSMINALAEMANNNDNPRPGLVIPPSAGPQTLHTLAVYFANALDGIASNKEEEEETEDENHESLTKLEFEKKRLTELLTKMTMDRYNELFHEKKEVTTVSSRSSEDLEAQHSKGLTQTTPKVRQLAKVFTQALSSYLDDPATFKKVLEEVRPTEPPSLENEETTDAGDDELLNFSDADSKSSFPPFIPTVPSVRPTWGFLVAYNTSHTLDVKNSISSDSENLQGADSQSLVSQLNKLHNPEATTKSSTQLPENHWTTSPDVSKLWSKAFSFNPVSINENFGTTEPIVTTTEEIEEQEHEVKYELKSLPNLSLNSTQVQGILIDFMNTTKKDEDNRLQRILKKLNTTQDEFLAKMKEIQSNPLTKRLILLLINECGNKTQEVEAQTVPMSSLIENSRNEEILETAGSSFRFKKNNSDLGLINPGLSQDNEDARALQLLNSLYTIASRFGK